MLIPVKVQYHGRFGCEDETIRVRTEDALDYGMSAPEFAVKEFLADRTWLSGEDIRYASVHISEHPAFRPFDNVDEYDKAHRW